MLTRKTLQEFERLQLESELIVEALRNVVPTITVSRRAYRRPRLSVVPVNDQTPGREIDWPRDARIS